MEKIKTYQKSAVAKIKGKMILPVCILCETEDNITVKALWVDDERETAIMYFLCKDCSEEFCRLSDADRQSIVTKVIEKKIDTMVALPHFKLSQLMKVGFEVGF